MTLILVSLLYVRRIQTLRNVTLRSTYMMSALCWTYAKETTWQSIFEVFTFDAYNVNVEVLRIL